MEIRKNLLLLFQDSKTRLKIIYYWNSKMPFENQNLDKILYTFIEIFLYHKISFSISDTGINIFSKEGIAFYIPFKYLNDKFLNDITHLIQNSEKYFKQNKKNINNDIILYCDFIYDEYLQDIIDRNELISDFCAAFKHSHREHVDYLKKALQPFLYGKKMSLCVAEQYLKLSKKNIF